MGQQFGWWGLALALLGAWRFWHHDRSFLVSSLLWILPVATYAFVYDTADSHIYLLPALMQLALWWGAGLQSVLARAIAVLRPQSLQSPVPVLPRARGFFTVALLLLPFLSLAIHWRATDLSSDNQLPSFLDAVFDSVEPQSLIIVSADLPTFALWYGVYAEGRRPDLAIVNGPLLLYPWYRDQMRGQYPELHIPEPSPGKAVTSDALVRDVMLGNWQRQTVYCTDPMPEWEEWSAFEKQDAPIYLASPQGP
jgi:hypothetical protein